MTLDRRVFLTSLGTGAFAMNATPTTPKPLDRPSLEHIAATFRTTARDRVFHRALELQQDGATWRDLLGGVFLAGVHDVVPRPVGFKFHCVLMTSSAYQIAEAVPTNRKLWPVLFNLDDYKRSQAWNVSSGGWQLPPPAVRSAAEPLDVARAKLHAAMDAWVEDAADRAASILCASASLDDAFETLWRYGARDFGNIGHKMIWAAQAYRTLQQIGWTHGEPVVRSLVFALLSGRPGENDATFAPNVARAAKIRYGWQVGDADPAIAERVLRAMRTADEDAAAKLVVDLLGGGASPGTIQDGLRLCALEILMRIPGLLAVHPLTTLNAFRFAFRRSDDDLTRRILLLQAASWTAAFRKFFEGRPGFDRDRPGIDALRPADASDVPATQPFAAAADDKDRGAALAAALVAQGRTEALAAAARDALMQRVREHHDYKFVAAALEEIALADPHWQPALAGASMFYMRTPADPDSPVHEEARSCCATEGVSAPATPRRAGRIGRRHLARAARDPGGTRRVPLDRPVGRTEGRPRSRPPTRKCGASGSEHNCSGDRSSLNKYAGRPPPKPSPGCLKVANWSK
jgi:hypothetical protein